MTATKVQVIADSISEWGDRITTLELEFPRYLLSEFNTHRVFSRNSASSRAMSVQKTIARVEADPYIPEVFPSERRGMSGGAELSDDTQLAAQRMWLNGASMAVHYAKKLAFLGVHKSLVNRVLEPYMRHTVVVTSTEWGNFLDQRTALLEDGTPAADLVMHELALNIGRALEVSAPIVLHHGDWHVPYVDVAAELSQITTEHTPSAVVAQVLRMSVARCAGVSYLTQGVDRDSASDIRIYGKMWGAEPKHWSPFEHVATPATRKLQKVSSTCYNLTGWSSLRWFLERGEQPDVEDVIAYLATVE